MSNPKSRPFTSRLVAILSMMVFQILMAFEGHAQLPLIEPSVADAGGGAGFFIPGFNGDPSFNDVPALEISITPPSACDSPYFCDDVVGTRGTFPEVNFLGLATLSLAPSLFFGGSYREFPDAVTFVDAALVDSMTPTEYSIGPDNRIVTLKGAGFPINRGVEVWVGDAQATEIAVDIYGDALEFRPPPFPGGEYPLTVDVRVVTLGGGETVLEDALTYNAVAPGFRPLVDNTSAWRAPFALLVRIDNFLGVDGYSFFIEDKELEIYCKGTECLREPENAFGITIPPPYPPGYISLTVKTPDGAVQTLEDGFRFTRTSPLHSADRNGDGVVSLSELLRVVQFYNEGGYRCAPEGVTSEDGFLPGPGVIPEDCRPHDSDLIDWDWQVDLSELLESIQLYNFGPYTLCADEVFFCPAE